MLSIPKAFAASTCPLLTAKYAARITSLEYVADIEYNSMILYPSHYWHNAYLKEDWFIDEDRVTFTGFFETKTTSSKTKKLGFG